MRAAKEMFPAASRSTARAAVASPLAASTTTAKTPLRRCPSSRAVRARVPTCPPGLRREAPAAFVVPSVGTVKPRYPPLVGLNRYRPDGRRKGRRCRGTAWIADRCPVEPAFDYLVVSDLHLRGGFNNPTQGLYHFDEEFADFLRYYRLHRSPSQRWRLVIAVTSSSSCTLPTCRTRATACCAVARFGESEYRYGANTEAQKSRWKLDTILRSGHPQLLLALARFVLDGNEIVILRGNHDIEMSWPEVQEHSAG